MAKYRATEQSFINDKLVEKDEIVEYTGQPGSNLELVKGNSKASAASANTGDASDLA